MQHSINFEFNLNAFSQETVFDDTFLSQSGDIEARSRNFDSAFLLNDVAALHDVADIRQRALSATRMGRYMQNQAQRCENISCCLELAKYSEQVFLVESY
jgi:hypothetical protein